MNINRDVFPSKDAISSASPQGALPVINQTAASLMTTVFTAGVDFTIPAGGAGTQVNIALSIAPILGVYGRTGSFGNSSFSWGAAAATTFPVEVPFVADQNNLGGDTTKLNNGEFMIDYEAGMVYAKKHDVNVTGTCTYSYLAALT